MDNNKLNAILRKLNAYRKDPDLVREPTLDEMATLIFFFLDQVKGFETSIKRGDLNGKTPEAGKDYPSKKQMLTELTKMVNSELTRLTKENDKQAKQITNALKAIRQPKDGKDGVVTEREIERAAEMAAVLIDLPDFDAMLAEAIQTDGATIRDALESLPEGEEQLSIEAIRGLRQELTDLAGKVGKETLGQFIGGGAAEKRIIQLIAEYSDSLPSQTGNSGKYLTTDGTDASWATLAGGGDMAAATYDPAGKSEQLLGISDILDEDNMASNSATKVPSQQSVKAYVDANAGGASAIDDLTDVTITTPADNEVLAYDTTSSKFINQTPTEAGLQGVLAEGAFVDGDKTKLDGIETGADVTDTTNVTAAGALMDSEVTNLAAVKAFDPTDYATAAQGATADSALQNVVEDTSPQLGGQLDVNGQAIGDGTRELLTFTEDASAVNHVNIENQATGGGPIISAAGDDTNIDLHIGGKGSGDVVVDTNIVPATDGVESLGEAAKGFSKVWITDSGSIDFGNGDITILQNGNYLQVLDINGNEMASFEYVSSAVNYLKVLNSATGNAVNISSTGGDTNIDLQLSPKGTGEILADGNVDMSDNSITGAGSISFTQQLDNGSKTASFSVDFSTDNHQKATLTANTMTITFDTTSIGVGVYTLMLVNPGLATITWAGETGSVYWADGTEPTWTSSGTDIISVFFDGTNFYCQAGQAFA